MEISLIKYYLAAPLQDLKCTWTTTNMEVIKSQKGGLKIIVDGYMYTKKYARKTAIRWECSKRIVFSCKAAITTGIDMKNVTSSTPHTHDKFIYSSCEGIMSEGIMSWRDYVRGDYVRLPSRICDTRYLGMNVEVQQENKNMLMVCYIQLCNDGRHIHGNIGAEHWTRQPCPRCRIRYPSQWIMHRMFIR